MYNYIIHLLNLPHYSINHSFISYGIKIYSANNNNKKIGTFNIIRQSLTVRSTPMEAKQDSIKYRLKCDSVCVP